jgi:hypothetical protein
MDERRQFRRLLSSFSERFLDNELLSAEGDARQTAVNALALIAALSVTLCLCYFYKYSSLLERASDSMREAISWGDKEFLLSLTMLVTGFVSVITWDALFPDHRDCLTLYSMPIRPRTIFFAKLTATLGLFAAVAVTLNAPTSVLFPWMALGDRLAYTHYFPFLLAHAVAACAASAFIFCCLLALQGLLVTVLSFRWYKWTASWVQMATLFVMLSAFFLMPNIAQPTALSDPRNSMAIHLLPNFWFLGLYEQLMGSNLPVVSELAGMARIGLAAAAILAFSLYAAGYTRYVRKTIEEAETLSGRTLRAGLLSRLADRFLLRRPLERAAFHFTARTMARNRKHRLLLAIYAGAGLAYVLSGASSVFQANGHQINLLNPAISSIPLMLSFFVLLGMRILFTFPVELRANWVFRLTENGQRAEYLSGVRKLMATIGIAPLALGTFPVYGFLWGWEPAARHLLLVTLLLFLALEYMLDGFPKIPFTCSYLPGKINLKAKIGVYLTLFTVLSLAGAAIELALVKAHSGFWIGAAVIAGVLAYRLWKRTGWERELPAFVYEETPDWIAPSMNLG